MPIIPNAKHYTVDDTGRVYRDGRRVKTRRTENGIFARIYHDDGEVHSVNVAQHIRNARPPLTLDFIFGVEGAKTHSEYPDYALTAYGDIYCIRPPKAGKHANGCYIVPDFRHGPRQLRYVSIRRPDGTRFITKLAKLVQSVWGNKSQFVDE
jgi:hypothetical protein